MRDRREESSGGGRERGREGATERTRLPMEGARDGGEFQGSYPEERTLVSIQHTKQPTAQPLPVRLWHYK